MKFNIEDYKGNYAMHCKTEEEARDFCKYLHSVGREWSGGRSYLSHTNWNDYKSDTVYFFNNNTYQDIRHAQINNYTILEWSDFMNGKFTKADLKTGDVIKRRNGWVEIVNCELKTLINKNGWNDLDYIREDLTSDTDSWDIVAVRRPIHKSDCQFNTFEFEAGTIVYERKEVEEMTLAEVCRLLGKEIKIVK